MLSAPIPVPRLPLSPGDKVVQDANKNIASNLYKVLEGSGSEEDTPAITNGPSIVEARDEAGKSRDPNFGRPFISNPDFPERIAQTTPLTPNDRNTWFTQGTKGYTDYV